MFVPLDFTALRTAPVEESVWPKSPATPKENVEVAAEAVGGLQLAGTHAASPTTASATRTMTGRRSRTSRGSWTRSAALMTRTSRSSAGATRARRS